MLSGFVLCVTQEQQIPNSFLDDVKSILVNKYKLDDQKATCMLDKLHQQKVLEEVYSHLTDDAKNDAIKIDEKLKNYYRGAEDHCVHAEAKEYEFTFTYPPTTTTPTTPYETPKTPEGLSGIAITLIVIGVLAVIAVILAGVVFFLRSRK